MRSGNLNRWRPRRVRFRHARTFTAMPPRKVLNGTWKFRLHGGARLAPADGWQQGGDLTGFGDLPVPSSWPMHGHGAPWYTNVQYPFAVEPPHVPDVNPIGDHVVEFEAGPEFFPRSVLRFDGIESAGTVWLNGTRLGTTRGSRLAHEFDVTDVLVPGRNILAVRVAQFSAASYLEDQDMWWLPGIFRDVTLQCPAGQRHRRRLCPRRTTTISPAKGPSRWR